MQTPVIPSAEPAAGPGVGAPNWVVIAANPHSGARSSRVKVLRLAQALRRWGLRVSVYWSLERWRRLAGRGDLSERCRCIVAAGGDGTVAAVINQDLGVPMAVMPLGTENLLARQLGLSPRPEHVAAMIVRRQTRTFDLGSANGRRFILMAGLGFDAAVVSLVHAARAGHITRVSYALPVIRSLFRYPFAPLEVAIPASGETLRGAYVFVFNLPRYGLGIPVAPGARADDGLLDLWVLQRPGRHQVFRYMSAILLGRHRRLPDVYHRLVQQVTIRAQAAVPMQLDGDAAGTVSAAPGGQVQIESLPAALQVIVPPGCQVGIACNPDPTGSPE